MARMTGASWRPIPANYTAMGQLEVRGVVVHIMAGTLPGTDSWFRNPAARASSHFGTGKDGRLYQWVDTKDRAWAQASGNTSWLSVENEGRGGDALTAAQLARCAEVLAWAHRVYSVPLQVANSPSGRGLGWHGMGGTEWGGHTSCPGPRIVAQLPEIVQLAQNIINEEDDPMAGYSKADIGDAVLFRDNIPAPKSAPDRATNRTWSLSSYAQTILNTLDALRDEVAAVRRDVDKIKAQK